MQRNAWFICRRIDKYLTAKACLELMSTRAKNDSLYNPELGTKLDRGILHITPDLMPEVQKHERKRYTFWTC
jgi:hypothetical protein